MLLTRSLPPQFLLPAWSARQLAGARTALQHQQRACKSDNARPDSNAHATNTARSPRAQNAAVSLFDELFPEEADTKERAAERQGKLDRLPAFDWGKTPGSSSNEVDRIAERRRRKETYNTIPQAFRSFRPEQPSYTSLRQAEHGERRREVSVLVLNSATKTLEESDFFRLGPKGEHIEGWTSGIVKGILYWYFPYTSQLISTYVIVIPGRDKSTLKSLGHYFLIFSSDAAAKAYLDNIFRLWRLAKQKGRWGSSGVPGIPLPPGLLKPGEDMKKTIQGFTLVPAYNKLFLRMISKPFRPAIQKILDRGGPKAITTAKSKAEDMVLISSDVGTINPTDLIRAIKDDGKNRNLYWKLAPGGDELVKLYDPLDDDIDQQAGDSSVKKKRTLRPPSRYVLSFRDRHEARRFVREWHKRPMPQKRNQRPGEELPPVVNAEILW